MGRVNPDAGLDRAVRRYRFAAEQLAEARERLKEQVRVQYDAGVPETQLATRVGVDRMTIRAWLGKDRAADG